MGLSHTRRGVRRKQMLTSVGGLGGTFTHGEGRDAETDA